jgi:hypothetical protein
MNRFAFLSLALVALLAACGSDEGPPDRPSTTSLLRTADYPGAIDVLTAKKESPSGEIVVVGRVSFKGDGAFRLVDDSLNYCGEGENTDDKCPTPWDYCCIDRDVVREATIAVRARDATGEPVPEKMLGIREADLVAVKGKLEKSGEAVVLVVTDGWHRRERPDLGPRVTFP